MKTNERIEDLAKVLYRAVYPASTVRLDELSQQTQREWQNIAWKAIETMGDEDWHYNAQCAEDQFFAALHQIKRITDAALAEDYRNSALRGLEAIQDLPIWANLQPELCHCGEPVHYYAELSNFTRGLCQRCSDVRCDLDPSACLQ